MATIDQRIRRISMPQAGVFTCAQALRAGISTSSLQRRVRSGAIRRLHRGVYFAGQVVTLEARRWAAVLAGGEDARLGGQAAEDDWGLARIPTDHVELLVTKRQRPIPGIPICQTRTLHEEDKAIHRGRRTISVERMLVDVSPLRTVNQLCRSLREASFRRMLDIPRLRRTIDRNAHKPGVRRLRRALELHLTGRHGGTDGKNEDTFARLLDEGGITNYETNREFDFGGTVVRVDFYLPDLDLVVEINPDFHLNEPVAREDKLRAALCLTVAKRHLMVPGDDLAWGVRQVLAIRDTMERRTA